MKLKTGRSGTAWARQTTFPSESYKSARAAHGIWQTSVKDMGRKPRVIVNLAPKQDLTIRFMPGFGVLYAAWILWYNRLSQSGDCKLWVTSTDDRVIRQVRWPLAD